MNESLWDLEDEGATAAAWYSPRPMVLLLPPFSIKLFASLQRDK